MKKEKTIKQEVKELILSYPIGLEFTNFNIRLDFSWVSQSYIQKLLTKEFQKDPSFSVRYISGKENAYRENIYYRMLSDAALIIIKSKVAKIPFNSNCPESYIRTVLSVIFDSTREKEVFTGKGLLLIFNNVVPEKFRLLLPKNLCQVIVDTCADFFSNTVHVIRSTVGGSGVESLIQKIDNKFFKPVSEMSKETVSTSMSQLDRVEKKLDILIDLIKNFKVESVKIEPVKVNIEPVYCSTSTSTLRFRVVEE